MNLQFSSASEEAGPSFQPPDPSPSCTVKTLKVPRAAPTAWGPSICFHLSPTRLEPTGNPKTVLSFLTQSINTTKSFTLIYDSGFIPVLPTRGSQR